MRFSIIGMFETTSGESFLFYVASGCNIFSSLIISFRN